MEKNDLCLVTGASGYLASWLVKDLLEAGYRVRGTVRRADDSERNRTLRELLPGVELVAADLRSPDGWDEAVDGVRWVFHVASPQAVATEKNRTEGAVAGTEYLVRAALGSPSVRKIVLTGSVAAVAYGTDKRRYDEDDWTDLDGPAGKMDYFRSKTLAERKAWELVDDPQANPRGVPLATVNPGFILGPTLVPWGRYSMQALQDQAEGRSPLLDMEMDAVDVRDCARMHIAVMADPAADGRRHLAMSMKATAQEQAELISSVTGPLGMKPVRVGLRRPALWFAKIFMSDAGAIYDKVGRQITYATKYPDVYTYRYTDLRASLQETFDRMVELGWIGPADRDRPPAAP
ncbi:MULTISPECIES: NAD-dependent epimerase/dehydratase family protein [unclassified Nocardiopsis]|uniref:NAD-dependent epimerase/dehydratase family protein n=1 Tax=Nocardiopsis TaxID=2013 RepID=UPI00387B000D